MEMYNMTLGREAMPTDLVAEEGPSGVGIGLGEPMWQLGIRGEPDSYPERPDEPDCIYYLRTGFCGYDNRCRFNHPRDYHAAKETLRASGAEYPERIGQPVCQYYMRTKMCKFGASCKYHHPKHGIGSSTLTSVNVYGYPLRPEEKECSYYIKTGQCKFGATCRFHHPQPIGVQVLAHTPTVGHGLLASGPAMPTLALYPTIQSPHVQSSQQYEVIPGNWHIPRPTMLSGSYMPESYGPMLLAPGVVPVPGWAPYPVQISLMAPPNAQYTGPYLPSTSAGPSGNRQIEHAFPERPGQPECHYYLRTGDCKFGPTCKYHHPPERKM